MRKIEVCCSSLDEVRQAARAGATRVELCAAIALGGLTPSAGLIQAVVGANLPIAVNVLIRCREGGFCYSDEEIEQMCRDIALCREAGADGVVIGALTHESEIDMKACRRMIAAAGGMSITFHRAFDVCRAPERALEQIISLGCHRLLTSGCASVALQGAGLIARLVEQASGRIVIMAGSGIRPENIALVEKATAAPEFHSTAAAEVADKCFSNSEVSFAADKQQRGVLRLAQYDIISQLVNG